MRPDIESVLENSKKGQHCITDTSFIIISPVCASHIELKHAFWITLSWKQKPIFARLTPSNIVIQSVRVTITLVMTTLSLVIWGKKWMTDEAQRDLGLVTRRLGFSWGGLYRPFFVESPFPVVLDDGSNSLNVTTSLPCLQIFRWVWSVVEGGKDTNSSPERVQGTVGLAVHSPGLVHPGLLWAGCVSYLKFTVPLGALWVSATFSSPSGLYQPSLSGYPQWFPYPFVIIPFITFSSKYPKFLPASLWYTDQLELWDTSISLFTYLSVILFPFKLMSYWSSPVTRKL